MVLVCRITALVAALCFAGPRWERASELLELNECDPVDEVFGNTVKHPAHKVDLIRRWALRDMGGAYIDIDVWVFRSYADFEQCPCVLGLQGRSYGLCNAVILAQPEGAFFWPGYDEPEEVFLEDDKESASRRISRSLREENRRFGRKTAGAVGAVYGPNSARSVASRREQDLARLRGSYAVHLWESKWWDDYLSRITPDWLTDSTCVLSERTREALGANTVSELALQEANVV